MQPCKTASAVHDCACCVGRRQQAYLSQKPWPDVELCSDRHAQTEQLSPACARLHLEQARARAEEIRRTAWIPALCMLAVRQSCLKVEEAEAGSFRETRPPRVSGNAERACSKAELQSRRTQERSACTGERFWSIGVATGAFVNSSRKKHALSLAFKPQRRWHGLPPRKAGSGSIMRCFLYAGLPPQCALAAGMICFSML